MFLIATRNFLPELGGIQILMTGLSDSLLDYGPVKVFAEYHPECKTFDKKFKFDVTRVSGIKLFRKFRKANLINDYMNENSSVRALICDHWKSLEYINNKYLEDKKTLCLVHSKEINHPINSSLNKRIIRSLEKANFIISNSNYTKNLAINIGISENKIKVIHPGINPPEKIDDKNKKEVEKILADSFPCLVTVARLEKRKNHDKIIMSVRNLKEKFPKIKYVCIGNGQEEGKLKKLVSELKLENEVIFKNNIDSNLKSAFLQKSDLFIMPSVIYKSSVEGFGISFIEAGSYGTTSIGGKDGGESDSIIHEKTGLICDGNDLDSIYKSIEYILKEKKYLQLSQNALEFSKKFEWKNTVKKYMDLLR